MYFAVLFVAALSAAAVALVNVSPMYELSNVWYGNVPRQWLASRSWDLHRTIWPFAIRPRQTHCFLDCRVLRLLHRSPDDIVHFGMSDLPRRTFPARQACRPCASTIEPQRQLCGWHVLLPRQKPTAIRMSSSDSRSPTTVMGGACSQSPVCSVSAAFNLAISVAVFVSSAKIF